MQYNTDIMGGAMSAFFIGEIMARMATFDIGNTFLRKFLPTTYNWKEDLGKGLRWNAAGRVMGAFVNVCK